LAQLWDRAMWECTEPCSDSDVSTAKTFDEVVEGPPKSRK